MINWNNMDKLASYQELQKVERLDLVKAMSGENGAERVKRGCYFFWERAATLCVFCNEPNQKLYYAVGIDHTGRTI